MIEQEEGSNFERVTNYLNISNTPSDEAAQNIDRANFYDVNPDSYQELKPHLEGDVNNTERVPAQVGNVTSDFVTQNTQIAAVAKDDISFLDKAERRFNYHSWKSFEEPEKRREANDLQRKWIDEGLSEGEQEYLDDLNNEISERELNKPEEIGDVETFISEGISATGDIVRSYTENKALLAGTIGLSTATGAAVGSFVPALGTLTGATVGFTKGTIAASMLVGFKDAYEETKGSMIGALRGATKSDLTAEQFGPPVITPLDIEKDKIDSVSTGVAVISGAIGAIPFGRFATSNPLLKKFASPKLVAKLVAGSPKMIARMNILGGIAKSALTEGGEEAAQEFISIVGESFGKMDDSEEGFLNTIDNLTEAFKGSLTVETLKQTGKAAALGTFAGGAFQGITSIPGATGLRKRFEKFKHQETKRRDAVKNQNVMLEVAAEMNQTKVVDLSASDSKTFVQKISSVAGLDDVWFTAVDLEEFASDDADKIAAIEKLGLSELDELGDQLNQPRQVTRGDVLELIREYPEASNHMRNTPDGMSPFEARTEAQEFAAKLEEAEVSREAIFESLGTENKITPEAEAQLIKIAQDVEAFMPFDSEFEYLDSVAFVETEGIMTKEESEVFNTKRLDAQLEVSKTLKGEVEAKFGTIENRIVRDVTGKVKQEQLKVHEKGLTLIDSFKDVKNKSEGVLATTINHKKKGFSPSAIDPKSLPEDLKDIYLTNKTLKKRKVFVDGGLNVEESATINGVESGEELLKLLINTPTHAEINKGNIQENIKIRNRIEQAVKPAKDLSRDKAFNNLNKIYIKEMEHFRSKEWPTVKRGVIKLAARVPSIASIKTNAEINIGNSIVRDINPNRYLQGQNKSQRLALQTFMDGKFEQSFANKEKAVINNEMRRQALNAKDQITANEKFWKNVLTRKSIQQDLKDAGYSKAMSDFTALFRLDGTNRNVNEQNSFNSFIKKQAELGEWTPEIPARLDNTQMSHKDLTFDQYQEITNAGRYLVQQAKVKNKLRKSVEGRLEAETTERFNEELKTAALGNINYDEKKIVVKETRNATITENTRRFVDTGISSLASLNTITEELDEYKPNGFFHQSISKPFKDSLTSKRFIMKEIADSDRLLVKEFYPNDDFDRMFNTFLDIPEFVGMQQLGLQDGKGGIRKTDLLVMFAYKGDPDTRERLSNYKNKDGKNLTIEQIETVLDRELSSNDVAFAQAYLVDGFKRFADDSKALHERTTGAEVQLVEGIENHHKGKALPGGYYPIKYLMKSLDAQAQEAYDENMSQMNKVIEAGLEFGKNAIKMSEGKFFAELRSAEQTKQGRLKSRTGSERPLSLDIFNLLGFKEEIVHDLSFRETGIDALKILKDKDNAAHMTSIVGTAKYGVLINSVKDVISKASNKKSTLFSEQNNWADSMIDHAHKVHAVQVIAYNYTSMLVQPVSLGNVVMRYGPKAGVYMAKTAAKMAVNPTSYSQTVDVASKINPDIQLEQDGIDDTITKNQFNFLPSSTKFFKKYANSSGQAMNRIAKFRDDILLENGFAGLRELDKANRVLTTLAISEMFLAGDIEGFNKRKVDSMSEADKADALRSITQQASDLSLTASSQAAKTPLEKNPAFKTFIRFFTDRRAGFNTAMASYGKTKSRIKRGEHRKAASTAITSVMVMGLMKAYIDGIRDEEEALVNKLKNVENGEEFIGFLQDATLETLKSPIMMTAENTPFLDGIMYQTTVKRRSDYRTVGTPFDNVRSQLSMTYNALNDILEGNELSKVDKKSLLTTFGYAAGGLPTNVMWRAWETMNESETLEKTSSYFGQVVEDLKNNIKKYIKDNSSNPEAQLFIDDLKGIRDQLPQDEKSIKELIPENVKADIKEIVSEGNWIKVDKETGAAGIYQFTKERWEDISIANPELGLTDNGRVSKSSRQQEKAMKWSIENNSQSLVSYEIPVTTENLLGAHKFGLDNYVAIFHNKGSLKLSKVLGDQSSNPEFKGFTTVRSVKSYLAKEVKKTI